MESLLEFLVSVEKPLLVLLLNVCAKAVFFVAASTLGGLVAATIMIGNPETWIHKKAPMVVQIIHLMLEKLLGEKK